MSSVVVTAVDVFSESDPDRPVASVTRRGGGVFTCQTAHALDTFESYEEALAAARAFAEQVDSGEISAAPSAEMVNLRNELADKDARILLLEAQTRGR